jgi:hypothetical protein
MSYVLDLVTFVIDLIVDSIAAKFYKRNPILAWTVIFVGLAATITMIVFYYRYF